MILPLEDVEERPSVGKPGLEVALMVLAGMAATQVHRLGALGVLAVLGPALVWRHRRDPATIAGIVITLFCVSPFLRRLADFRFGFTPSSQVLASPYAAVGMVGFLVLRGAPLMRREHLIPTMVSLSAIAYAYCMGVLNAGIVPASIGLLQFSAGPLLLLVLNLRRERFSLSRLQGWIGSVAFLTAAYGLYQYAVFPPWEELWLVGTNLAGAGGQPVPFGIRTWSTLNSMAPFSYFMAFTLVALSRTKWFVLLGPVCILALISTMGRSAWGTAALGWLLALLLLRNFDRSRLLVMLTAVVGLVLATAVFLPSQALERAVNRIETLGNLEGDQSYNSRVMIAQSAGNLQGIQKPGGMGLGSTGAAARVGESGGMAHLDNGFVALAFTFGWFGSFLYFGGFFGSLAYALFRLRQMPSGAVLFLCAATALFAANVFENTMSDFRGVLLWVAVGSAIAVRDSRSTSTPQGANPS